LETNWVRFAQKSSRHRFCFGGYGGYDIDIDIDIDIRSRLWLRVRRATLDFVATIIRFVVSANRNSARTPWANSSSGRL
jgi:hypothetical protein